MADRLRDGEPALRVVEAHKSYGERRALAGLSLSVGQKEWVGLLGPNGAGKSTLMGAIAGLTHLDDGEVELFGNALRGRAPEIIGFVPQEIALYPLLDAVENLRVFGRLHGVRGRQLATKVDWALEWTGLARRAREPVSHFSGGMQRRLNIACGVLHAPRLVLLDEPTVGVDPQGRQRIWAMLDELRQSGASLVQSTHELHEIESVCDRMLIMDRGRILAAGTVSELVAEAFGERATLRLSLDRAADPSLAGEEFVVEGNTVHGALRDVAVEVPAILATLNDAGHEVRRMQVERPGLEAVFTHLTGRELRE